MKVLQINTVCGIGSTGRIATDIHNILNQKGYESYIAYGRDYSQNCETTIKIGGNLDIYEHVALTRVFDKHGFGSFRSTKDFIQKVKRINPDIIHLHNIHGYYINIELLFNYLKEVNKPIVWTLHDCWAFTGHCSHFDYIGCNKWKSACYSCPQKSEYPKSVLFDNSKENYIMKKELFTGIENLTIVTPSKWLGDLVRDSYLKSYPVRVINNGVDLNVFKPTNSNFRSKYNIKNKFIILGVASVWGERKGFDQFLKLSEKLEHDQVIVLVGVTENQKKKLPENIIGITRTNDIYELAEIYTASDVLVNPTLEDNFPTVNIESLACGTPVMTYCTGGSTESIDDSCGVVIEKENLNELVESIGHLKNRKLEISSNDCIERARNLYDKWEKYNEYVTLYEEVLPQLSSEKIFELKNI
ncbi:glycosyltransferase [Halalkalibacter okhensis]|uniref:Glycosyl transferase n=1 Tax=Halalkalibacter okhensis TaxID=333138 RepID=A0A0B0IF16_9BACI|nr:glycosyltransferase [Halalkalibacter okhensis]KHF38261.1 glycosyl transferase [Halalkalibacter okhensis]